MNGSKIGRVEGPGHPPVYKKVDPGAGHAFEHIHMRQRTRQSTHQKLAQCCKDRFNGIHFAVLAMEGVAR